MKTFVVLFRGINVGGNNRLPMKELVPLLEHDGFKNVTTYIQSGNVILNSIKNPCQRIQEIVSQNFGFTPDIFVLTAMEFFASAKSNPYQKFEGKYVHVYFCQNKIHINTDKLNKFITGTEVCSCEGNVFYLHAPDGIGRSKLVANIATCLDQNATGRNLNTINKIGEILRG